MNTTPETTDRTETAQPAAQPKRGIIRRLARWTVYGFLGLLAIGVVASLDEGTAETAAAPAPIEEPAPEVDTAADEGEVTDPLADVEVPESEPEPDMPRVEVDDPPTDMAIGDTAVLGPEWDEQGTHTITVEDVKITTTPYDTEYGQGPAREAFVIFEVQVEATDSSSVWDSDFYIVTDDGERIDSLDGNAYEAIDFDEGLGMVELDAGQHKGGKLAFDSPVKSGTLAYNPNYEGDPIATWKF